MFLKTSIILALLAVVSTGSAYSCSCNGREYNNDDISDAVDTGFAVDPIANPIDQTKFPRRYGLTPTDDYPFCGAGHFVEYPLLRVPPGPYDPNATPVLDPGYDRVVYLTGDNHTFCGCLTGEGQPANSQQLELCTNSE
ncbi:hypothetical protein NP233_g11142 [Leucocoprinus birnbaumii]|uniref:Uncharacterized protein n=1 Tax=Leucocoprinus birnbaumii TaxID=56174 RepID=A0AAD5YLJ4_9AGAR|nr:hypothetical protein NP233_g11142 [Leucocoprinus birnbaumii]